MPRYPWFRVYNEILTERKIERIGRMTQVSRVIIRGTWMTILAMANDSPQRGHLMWTDSLWITEQEIADDLEMEHGIFGMLLDAFIKMQMVTRHNGGGLSCTNFDKRQFKSDSSTARVQAWREKQQSQETGRCNVAETLPCNGPDTETEADTETETEADHDHVAAPAAKSPNTPAMDTYLALYGKFQSADDLSDLLDVEGQVGSEKTRAAIQWAHSKGIKDDRRMAAICTAARNWTEHATGPPGGDGRKPEPTNVQLLEQIMQEAKDGDP